MFGEIIAGILFGPYLFGNVPLPGFPNGLFETSLGTSVPSEIIRFATVSSALLVFLIGLETNLPRSLKHSFRGTLVGAGGGFLSFILGDLVTVFCSRSLLGVEYGFADPVPLFLGAASAATSIGLATATLSKSQRLRSPEGRTILSAAVIDDFIGILLLLVALSVGRLNGAGWGGVSVGILKPAVILAVFVVLGRYLSRPVSSTLNRLGDPIKIAAFCFGMILLILGLLEYAKVSVILGAYTIGLFFSQTDLAFIIRDKSNAIYRLIIPVFFCTSGMLIDFGSISYVHVLFFTLIYTAVVVVAKIVGCGIPAVLMGLNARGALRVGFGMVPRGGVAVVVSSIGVLTGLLSQDAFVAALVMTGLTALIAVPLFSTRFWSEGTSTQETRSPEERLKHITFAMPSREAMELVLSKLTQSFEGEGFHVSLLNLRSRSYRIQKQDTVIGMKMVDTQILFECDASDETFVDTVMYELLVEIERSMKDLQAFAESETIRTRMFAAGDLDEKQKSVLARYIDLNWVKPNLQAKTKREVIEEMLDVLVQAGDLRAPFRDATLRDLLQREATLTTGMQDGIALPHARTSGVTRIMCAVGVHKSGLNFNSLDGKPSHIFVLILAPEGNPGEYLQLMALVSALLSNRRKRALILTSKTKEDLYETIVG